MNMTMNLNTVNENQLVITNPNLKLSNFTPDLSIENSPIDPTQIYLVSPNPQWNITNLIGNVNNTNLIGISYQINNGNPITINLNENGEFSQPLELTGLQNSYPNLTITATYLNGNTVIDSRNLGVILTTETGLGYLDIEIGNGLSPDPSLNDQITVDYTGTLTNGTVFDSSRSRGVAAEFPINGVIPGFREGLDGMNAGGRRILFIPSDLGYGSTAVGNIPPNSTLIFDVELLAVNGVNPPVNRPPIFGVFGLFTIQEKSLKNTIVGTVSASDQDGDTVTYSIIGGNTDVNNNGNLPFAIDASTGVITVNDSNDLVFATQPTFDLVVRASDPFAATADITVVVNLQKVVINPNLPRLNLFGGQGDNVLNAMNIANSEAQSFKLFGGSGHDNLIAKGALTESALMGDRLFGGNDNDTLDGSQGTGGNFLYGGQGDDVLIAGQGDLLVGGSGNDRFKLVNNSLGGKPIIILDCDRLTDKIDLSELTVNSQKVTFSLLSFETETSGRIALKVQGIDQPIVIFAGLNAGDLDQENLYIFE